MSPAHVDCPPCPRCGLPVGVTYNRNDRPLPPPQLRCPACGAQWEATPEDHARAAAADAAWCEAETREAAVVRGEREGG